MVDTPHDYRVLLQVAVVIGFILYFGSTLKPPLL
jgi:hypothetical protein